MTLWEVAQELRAKGEHLTENAERQFAYFTAASMIEEWATERAKQWPLTDPLDFYRVEPSYKPFVDDLGVPEGVEAK